MKNYLFIILILMSSCEWDGMLNPSDEVTGIDIIDIAIEHENYLALVNNRSTNLKVPCGVKYKGERYPAQIRSSGAGSRYYFKWSYRVILDDGYDIKGINEFNLSSQVEDPSMVKTTLTSYIYRESGFIPFNSFHVFLRINNKDEGLYYFIEVIKDDFFSRHQIPVYELYKLGFSSALSFTPSSYPEFTFSKQIPDDNIFYNLINLINAIDETSGNETDSSLSRYIDLEQYMVYHSITSISANVDAFSNNFYLYKESPHSPFRIIPWDFDKSFYTAHDVSMIGENALIRKIFTSDNLFARYKQIMLEQLNDLMDPGKLFPIIDSSAAAIKYSYNLDPYLGRDRFVFEDEIERLKEFIISRKEFLLENFDHLQQDYFER